jgi:hypothetical protein
VSLVVFLHLVFSISGHEGIANQDNIALSSHPSQNGYQQEFKQQMLVQMQEKGTLGGNVN